MVSLYVLCLQSVGASHVEWLLQKLSQQLKMKLVDGVDVAEDCFHRVFWYHPLGAVFRF